MLYIRRQPQALKEAPWFQIPFELCPCFCIQPPSGFHIAFEDQPAPAIGLSIVRLAAISDYAG